MSEREDPSTDASADFSAGRPIVLAAVQDTTSSLAALLLAAEITAAQNALLHVAHIVRSYECLGALGMALAPAALPPLALRREAARSEAAVLKAKAAAVLDLVAPVDWFFTWHVGRARTVVDRIASSEHPLAVVVGGPRRRFCIVPSLAQRLVGTISVPAIVVGP